MKHIVIILIFISSGLRAYAKSENLTHLEYSQVRWQKELTPQKSLISELEDLGAIKKEKKGIYAGAEFDYFDFKESIYYISRVRRTKLTFVYIHGLYGSAMQFKNFFQSLMKNHSGSSFISLTLPGHFRKKTAIVHAKKDEWIEAVRSTLKIAKQRFVKTF